MADGILALLGALLGGVFGPYFAGFWQRHFSNRRTEGADDAARLSRIETRSGELRDLALRFWNTSAAHLATENDELLARIVGVQHELGLLTVQVFPAEHSARESVLAIQAKLFDAVSGGDFDEPARQRSKDRLTAICYCEARFRILVSDLHRV